MATASPSITLLKIEKRESEKWPPGPGDFTPVFDKLKLYSPKAIAVEPILGWQDPGETARDPIARAELSGLVRMSTALKPLLLGVQLENNPAKESLIDAKSLTDFKPIKDITGDISNLPQFTGIKSIPPDSLRMDHDIAHTHIEFATDKSDQDLLKVPLLARHQNTVIASFVLKSVMLYEDIQIDQVSVKLGDSIRVGDSLRIPIDASGHLAISPDWNRKVISLSSSVLFNNADSIDEQNPALLLSGESLEAINSLNTNLILIGLGEEGVRVFDKPGGGTITRSGILANAIAAIQSGRFQIRLSNHAQYLVWSIIIILGVISGHFVHRRSTAVAFGALGMLAIVIVSLLTFQSSNHWCPPTIPAALVMLSAVFAWFSVSDQSSTSTEENA